MKLCAISIMAVLGMFILCCGSVPASDTADALVYVSGNGDLEKVKFLVSNRNADVNGRDSMGITPLWAAARSGQLPIVKYLVERKATLDARCIQGETALIAAAAAGQTETVVFLIKQGARGDLKDQNGWTAQKWAEINGHRDTRDYLKTYESLVAIHMFLLNSIAEGRTRQVQDIISAGFDVNFMGLAKKYLPPLTVAVKNGRQKIARYLVDQGADVNLVAANKVTPLHQAVQNDDVDMVKLLLENGAEIEKGGAPSPLLLARRNQSKDILALLESKKAEQDLLEHHRAEYLTLSKQLDGYRQRTPADLTESDVRESVTLIQKIVELEDQAGPKTVLAFRLLGQVKGAAEKLFEEAPKQIGKEPFTPLMSAASSGVLRGVRNLVESGADVNEKNGISETALLAAMDGKACSPDEEGLYMTTVKYLVDKGADVNAADVAGRTPLILAAAAGDLQIVRLLLSKGALVDAVDSSGETALSIARRKGHKAVAQALEKAAPKKSAKSSSTVARPEPTDEDD